MAGDRVPLQDISHRRLAEELKALIDILRDPLAVTRRPIDYANAYRDLLLLVSDEGRWGMIFAVQDGCKSNYVLTMLTPLRVEWLKAWREMSIKQS